MAITMQELEERIEELRARLPRHSVPPAMLLELEELEEELAARRRREPAGRETRR